MAREIAIDYCPRCGGRMSIQPPADLNLAPSRVCLGCGLIWHADPKVACAGIVVYERKVLMLKRARPPMIEHWCLPGGFVDRGETMEAATRREVFEETGIETDVERLFGLYSYPGYPIVVGIFEMRLKNGPPVLDVSAESLEARWFGLDEVPWDNLAFPSTLDSLKELALRLEE